MWTLSIGRMRDGSENRTCFTFCEEDARLWERNEMLRGRRLFKLESPATGEEVINFDEHNSPI